jgi:hypothetical protein
MAVVRGITEFDEVELLGSVGDAPAGARGGVIELSDADTALVEITMPELDSAARIVFVPVVQLRRIA